MDDSGEKGAREETASQQEARIKQKILDDLEETYHGIERRRLKTNGRKVLSSIDRWGPGVIALVTLLAVIALGWTYGERISRAEGVYLRMSQEMNSYRKDIQSNNCSVQMKALETKLAEDRSDWQFAIAKLENFQKIVTRILIRAQMLND